MTEQPLPEPGNYQPQAGYQPPPPHTGAPSDNPFTPWLTRALAFLIDCVPYVIIVGIGYGIEAMTQETLCTTDTSEYNLGQFCVTGNSTIGVAAFLASVAVGFAYLVWNYGYKQGTTGASIGKAIMKFKVVGERTGQPIGVGMSIVRQLAHFLDAAICYIGYLLPLFDAKRQTIADKVMKTVCLPLP
ncbi:MAG: RDD family protein [Mycobacterium sp.]|nr:RDD family protein [Mycobacterium sp.]